MTLMLARPTPGGNGLLMGIVGPKVVTPVIVVVSKAPSCWMVVTPAGLGLLAAKLATWMFEIEMELCVPLSNWSANRVVYWPPVTVMVSLLPRLEPGRGLAGPPAPSLSVVGPNRSLSKVMESLLALP